MSHNAHLLVTATGLTLPEPAPASVPSLDVVLNGHRVWSIDLISEPRTRDQRQFRWPSALEPYLDGVATVDVRDSVTGRNLWTRDVTLGRSRDPIVVVDAHGRHLAVNKWGRLGKSFDGDATDLRHRILDHLDELLAITREEGLRPFVVGGTLLGAVREGAILGHDDDADLAYLSEHTHPADLAIESFAIERALTRRGLDVLRHSAAHLQITFRTDAGAVDGYVDLFTAFFKDGYINQPFHVRGRMAPESMLPFSTVRLEGREYPAPARPEDWLVINYDANWRTPLPGYTLHTPETTSRRFQNWFGTPNFGREFWEERRADDSGPRPAPDVRPAELLHGLVPAGSAVLDLGAGRGAQAARLAELGHPVTAVDYASDRSSDALVEWCAINLAAPRETAELLQRVGAASEPTHALAAHLVERMSHVGRPAVWRLLRQVVRRGGTALLVVDTIPDDDVSFDDPTTWHLEVAAIDDEVRALGLRLTGVVPLGSRPRDRRRGTVVARIAVGEPDPSKEGDD